uniref:Uncharacterized protein n=1 Tax=Setaria italica TaxID=4555 RepID=K3ZPG3_SETIT
MQQIYFKFFLVMKQDKAHAIHVANIARLEISSACSPPNSKYTWQIQTSCTARHACCT